MNHLIKTSLLLLIFLTSCSTDKSTQIREKAKNNIKYVEEINALHYSWNISRDFNKFTRIPIHLNIDDPFGLSKSENKIKICNKAKKIKHEFGIPKIDMIGETNSNNFLLVIKDCNCDIDFQLETLNELENELGKKNVSSYYYAMLEDRIRVNQGDKQKYGTIIDFIQNGETIMDYEIKLTNPVEDSLNLDKIRAEIGLPRFSDFQRIEIEKYRRQFYFHNTDLT